MKKLLIIIILTFTIIGCEKVELKPDKEPIEYNEELNRESDKTMKVIINNKEYVLNLTTNKVVEEISNMLPLEVTMTDLHNNEKYVYLSEQFTTNEYNPKHIEKGDVMLFGNNCLVIFYKSFDTTFSYTKIGHIDNLEDLDNKDIHVIIK